MPFFFFFNLRHELFQHLREVGNCICFFRLLGSAMSHNAMEEFQCRGFYEGVRTPRHQQREESNILYSEADSQFLKPKQSPFSKIITDASQHTQLPPRTREFLQSVVSFAHFFFLYIRINGRFQMKTILRVTNCIPEFTQ